MPSTVPSTDEANAILNCVADNFQKLTPMDQFRIMSMYINFINGLRDVFENYPDILTAQLLKRFEPSWRE